MVTAEYMHGSARAEQLRLEAAAKLLGGANFLPSLEPSMRLLDVGCGTGAIARETASKVTLGEIIGVDRDGAQIETAARFAAGEGLGNIRFMEADAENLPFEDEAFDGAYCRFLLEHVSDPRCVLSEMRRVVRSGRWVCVCEWEPSCFVNYPESSAIADTWCGIYSLQKVLGGDPWVARKLFALLTKAGFLGVRVEGHAWTITAAEKEKLRLYVQGAQEIIRQTSEKLMAEQLVTAKTLEQAHRDYCRLLEDPVSFVFHGYCRALGFKPGVPSRILTNSATRHGAS